MPTPDLTPITRRHLLGAAAGLAGSFALGASASGQSATPETDAASPWSYTDVLGTELTLPQPPVRIAANLVTAAALWDLGIKPVAVFDWTASAYPEGDHIAWGNIDPEAVANIGDIDGNIQPEQLLEVEPDVVLTLTFRNDDPGQIGGIPLDFLETINAIAPVLVVTDMGPTDVQLQRLVDLAASLGADLSLPEIVAAQDAYTAKVEEFREVAAAQAGLATLFVNFDEDAIYIGGPGGVAELQFLASLGLTFANADAEAAGDFWETLSVEQSLLYPADVVFSDVYSTYLTAEDLQAHDVFGTMPAVAAGQVGLWKRDFPVSHAGITDFLETLLVTLRDAGPAT